MWAALCRRRLRPLVALAALLPAAASAQAPDDAVEVFWEFRYSGIVNTVVTSRYDGERFFLSLGDVFQALQLNLLQDPDAGTASGFFVRTDRPFRLDFAGGRATVGSETHALEPDDFLTTPTGFLLRPEALERIFGLAFTLDERQLALRMQTEEEMPVVAAYRRQNGMARRTLSPYDPSLEHAPLRFGRDRALLSGGVLGYRFGLNLQGDQPSGSTTLSGGGEVLGGDAQVTAFASYGTTVGAGSPLDVTLSTVRWRYVPEESPYLRQVQAGRLSTAGLRSLGFDGLSVSNEPVQIERFFGSAPLHVETGPEWELELYLNSQLVEATRASAAGTHTFQVPITYGTTQVRVVEYGPNGEIRETNRQVQIPFTFVPNGQLRYAVAGGRSSEDGRATASASAAFGLSRWMTVKGGVDYVRGSGDTIPDTRAAYGTLSTRLGGPFVLTATAAPGALYTASLNAYHASLLSYNVEFTKFGAPGVYNRNRAGHETLANVIAPLRVRGLPVYLRANLTERKSASGRYDFNVAPEVSVQPGAFQLSVGYRGGGSRTDGEYQTTSQSLETRVGYAFGSTSATNPVLRGVLLSGRSSYDVQRHQLQSLNLNLARTITPSTRAQVDLSHLPSGGVSTLSFRLQFTLPYARASSGVQSGTGLPVTLTQDVSGAVSYDAGFHSFKMLQQDWVGRAAATVRMFVDEDGDGRWDEGETIIPNGGVQFRQAVTTQAGDDGTIVASNMQAYEQYSLEVDQTRIRNPLWVPRFEEFSFIADPNRHKTIEIPFYVAGQALGSALLRRDGELKPVPGLKVHLRQTDGSEERQQAAFSDGSFDLMGLPPGDYELSVDSVQLSVLKVVSEPAVRRFTLRPTQDGDLVEGLDFVLHARDEADPTPARTPTEGDALPAAEPDPAAPPAPPAAPPIRRPPDPG